MSDLRRLDPGDFDPRTHAALIYVRSFLIEVEGVPSEVEERFTALYSPEERQYVTAAMKGMFCVNLLVNTWRWINARITGRPLQEACPI